PSRAGERLGGDASPYQNKKPALAKGRVVLIKDGLAFGQQLGRAFGGGVGFLARASRGAPGGGLRAFARFGYLGGLGLGACGGAFFAFTGLQRCNGGERSDGQTEDEFFHTYCVDY
ncbi:MAG: hypothetical protein L0Y70_09235, partial [Gemmataceae bacterium]|nr:hypothetical protein [Gemmataceae bacterium]